MAQNNMAVPRPDGSPMPPEQQEPSQGGQEQRVDPRLQKETEAVVGGISKMLHGKETKGKIYEMLKSAPPEQSVPQATFLLSKRMYDATKKKGQKPSIEASFGGAIFATAELIEIGNAGGFFKKELGENEVQPVLQASIQKMIEEGVRSKMFDPIELQQKIEPLFNDKQRAMALEAGRRSGVPEEPGMSHAMEQYAGQAVEKEREMMTKREAAQNRQGMMQQVSQGGQ